MEWFEELATPIVCDFLLRWPTLDLVKQASTQSLEEFFRTHNSNRKDVVEGRIKSIKESLPLVTDRAQVASSAMMARALASQMKTTLEAIREFDRQIEALRRSHQEQEIFAGLPGAGPVYVSRLVAVFGNNREKFESADELSCLCGIAPVLERSGKSCWVRWRYLRSEVFKADISGVCWRINQAQLLGEGVLRVAEGEREKVLAGSESIGLKVDKDNLEVLEDEDSIR